MAAILHVVALWQGRDHRRSAADLADAAQYDLRPSFIEFDVPHDLDRSSRQPTHVANVFQIVGEDDYHERTRGLIFAEVEEVHSALTNFHAEHLSGDAFCFVDVISGFLKGNAIRGGEERCGVDYEHRDYQPGPTRQSKSR